MTLQSTVHNMDDIKYYGVLSIAAYVSIFLQFLLASDRQSSRFNKLYTLRLLVSLIYLTHSVSTIIALHQRKLYPGRVCRILVWLTLLNCLVGVCVMMQVTDQYRDFVHNAVRSTMDNDDNNDNNNNNGNINNRHTKHGHARPGQMAIKTLTTNRTFVTVSVLMLAAIALSIGLVPYRLHRFSIDPAVLAKIRCNLDLALTSVYKDITSSIVTYLIPTVFCLFALISLFWKTVSSAKKSNSDDQATLSGGAYHVYLDSMVDQVVHGRGQSSTYDSSVQNHTIIVSIQALLYCLYCLCSFFGSHTHHAGHRVNVVATNTSSPNTEPSINRTVLDSRQHVYFDCNVNGTYYCWTFLVLCACETPCIFVFSGSQVRGQWMRSLRSAMNAVRTFVQKPVHILIGITSAIRCALARASHVSTRDCIRNRIWPDRETTAEDADQLRIFMERGSTSLFSFSSGVLVGQTPQAGNVDRKSMTPFVELKLGVLRTGENLN